MFAFVAEQRGEGRVVLDDDPALVDDESLERGLP
jgi:hypothetical protein